MKSNAIKALAIIAGALCVVACAHQEPSARMAGLQKDQYTLTCTRVEGRIHAQRAIYMSQPVRLGGTRAEFDPLYTCSVDRDDPTAGASDGEEG